MATTTNVDRMARTAREMTEAQRDSYEALAENLAASQKRTIGLANDGLKFFRLQQSNVRAAQEWFANGVRLFQLQQRNAEFLRGWASDAVEAVREQTEHNVRTTEAFARGISKQQEGFQALAQEWTGAYEGFIFSPFNLAQEGLRTTERVTERGLQATQQVARQGLRVAEEATEQTQEVLRQTEEATREAELRTSVLAALETDNYDGLTVAEITQKFDDLSVDELKQLREFEKRNKDRESLVERIDRKIRATL